MITFENFGRHNGKELLLFTLKNSSGAFAELTNYGAGIVSIMVPGADGKLGHAVLGFNEPQGYLEDKCYIGSTIGRFANRIGNAAFMVNNKKYELEPNDGEHSNHGGSSGYNYRVFDFEIEDETLIFKLTSPDGDGGFPGSLELSVACRWTETNQLKIRYLAKADKATIAGFTSHAYFNLSGSGKTANDHRLTIYADNILETTKEHIPTGKIISAGNRKYSGDNVGDKMKANGSGFNHYYILDDKQDGLKLAAVLDHEDSGRRLNVYTTYPGLMFYTGDFLESTQPGHSGINYHPFDGFCLECQHYPDAPNHPHFPSVVLNPGELYDHEIIYEFSLIANNNT